MLRPDILQALLRRITKALVLGRLLYFCCYVITHILEVRLVFAFFTTLLHHYYLSAEMSKLTNILNPENVPKITLKYVESVHVNSFTDAHKSSDRSLKWHQLQRLISELAAKPRRTVLQCGIRLAFLLATMSPILTVQTRWRVWLILTVGHSIHYLWFFVAPYWEVRTGALPFAKFTQLWRRSTHITRLQGLHGK